MKNQKFYLITETYTGPNMDQHIDEDVIQIRTEPARTNSSGEIRISGWCGTTDDWSVHAHGEYDSIEAAKAAIKERFDAVRPCEVDLDDDVVVNAYLPGEHIPMTSQQTGDWIFDSLLAVTANSTDEDLGRLAARLEHEAREDGLKLHSDLIDMLKDHRSELRAE